jgi:hypothetical protein
MLPIPSALQARFEEELRIRAIQKNLQWVYKKWLRYYLDFCSKYNLPPKQKSSLPQFIRFSRQATRISNHSKSSV